ncbi:MAG: SRPBCC family protein, partial [Arenicellales bacterium WSBS_2016_MAG_OTU3]
HLHGVWEFKPLSIDNERAACHVALSMEFDFAGSLINRVVAPVFTRIADTMLDAFIQRAESVYGKRQLA